MKKFTLLTLTLFALCTVSATATAQNLKVGFVNFKDCVAESKRGQQEQNTFESIKKQMGEALEKAENELEEIAMKLEDQDYMDGLSPSAEEELKQKFQLLSQEFSRYQGQYYQLLNQANYKMLQVMHDEVSQVAEKVREKHSLALLLSEDSTFAYAESLDYTQEVIKELDLAFDVENDPQVESVE
ncbi:MAG: hypothetical protein K940chlam9_00419 [Chlamydiae bacterium]|nr:hypothetical protein [Chlamydiota bacterium]